MAIKFVLFEQEVEWGVNLFSEQVTYRTPVREASSLIFTGSSWLTEYRKFPSWLGPLNLIFTLTHTELVSDVTGIVTQIFYGFIRFN